MTANAATPADLRATIRASLVKQVEALLGELKVGTIESHPYRVAMADGTALVSTEDGAGYRLAFGDARGDRFTLRGATLIAAQWNKSNPKYPVSAMTRRAVAEARLAALREMLVVLDGF